MGNDFDKIAETLFAMLDEQGKSLLRKLVLIRNEREEKLCNDIEDYKNDADVYDSELDDQFDKMEKFMDEIDVLTDEIDKNEKLKEKMKNKIKHFKKERKELVTKKRGIAVSKGRLKSKYVHAIDAMTDIYDICGTNHFSNIDNLKRRMRRITGAFVLCSDCKQPLNDCQCD